MKDSEVLGNWNAELDGKGTGPVDDEGFVYGSEPELGSFGR
jgi:hypothetical protein